MATVVDSTHLTYKPMYLQAVTGDAALNYTAEEWRNFVGAVFPKTGILGMGFRIYPYASGANWSVDISPGFAVVGDSVNEFDRYLCFNPARFNVSINGVFNTAPTATRTHRVFLTVYDKQVSGSLYTNRIVITEDTGAGAPLPADGQSYYLELGQFTIASGQSNVNTANITNSAQHAGIGNSPQNLPLLSNVQNGTQALTSGAGPARYQIRGSAVVLSGSVQPNGTTWTAGNTYTIGTLPPEAAPKYRRCVAAAGPSGHIVRYSITPDGKIDMEWADSYNPSHAYLDGVTFELE